MTSPSSTTSTIAAAVSLLSGEAEGMLMLVCVVCVFVCLIKCVFVVGTGFCLNEMQCSSASLLLC